MGHLLGYARVSTNDQDAALQVDALNGAGCYRVFVDTMSGSLEHRPELDKLLDQIRPGDTLVVWRLDRLGRKWDRCVDIGVPAVEPLIATLRGDSLDRAAAAEALVQIGAPAVEPLVAALKDPEKRVRDAAAATLERVGAPRDQEPGHGPRDLQDRMEESQMKLGTRRVYVGPLLYGLYEGMDSKSREAFKNFVASASPKHELTATFPSMPARGCAVIPGPAAARTHREELRAWGDGE